MKLRIRSNTLRFRLGRQEVALLAQGGGVEEQIRFGHGPENEFVYRVESSSQSERMALRYTPGQIVLLLSPALCSALENADTTGFEEHIIMEQGDGIDVLIEKDFACLKPRNPREDEGTFPHPLAAAK